MSDNINPDHYKNSTSLECIEAMQIAFGREHVFHFCICNTWKYIWRWKNKNGVEDLKKAQWYVNRAKEIINDPETSPMLHSESLLEMTLYIERELKGVSADDSKCNIE